MRISIKKCLATLIITLMSLLGFSIMWCLRTFGRLSMEELVYELSAPLEVKITFPDKKKNLIYIYLESMEMTYSDIENGGGFTYNLIPELTKLAEEKMQAEIPGIILR